MKKKKINKNSIQFFQPSRMFFYANNIFKKFTSEPSIVEIVQLKKILEVPLPALTLCSPIMAPIDYAPYGEFLQTRKTNKSLRNFSSDHQKKLAALSQACFLKKNNKEILCMEENVEDTVKYLEEGKTFDF